MDAPASLRFAHAARQLADAARLLQLRAPGFRSPPRTPGVDRAVLRRPTGSVVAVRLAGRPFADVLADMVEGVILVNQLRGEAAMRARMQLWNVVAPSEADAA